MRAALVPPEVAAGCARVLAEPANVVADLTPEWVATTRSVLVETASGRGRFVVQWPIRRRDEDRRGIGRRLRLGRDVARVAPWLPVPEVLGGDARGPAPFLVSRFVAGVPGGELLGDDASAAVLGAAAGRLARDIARVPTAGLRLRRTWSDADLLGAAAARWLEAAGSSVRPSAAARLRDIVQALPEWFGPARPVFAHGDLAPVNVVIRDGEVAALLDLEHARLAHPLFDAARWRWIVRYHHPERWPAAGEAFLAAAGLAGDADTRARLNALAVLQCLEVVAATPARDVEARQEWGARIAAILGWADEPPPNPAGRLRTKAL